MEDIIYSFCWNPHIMEDMIRNFKGNYYITHSIYERYQEEMEHVIADYQIDRRRIFMIEDAEARILFTGRRTSAEAGKI